MGTNTATIGAFPANPGKSTTDLTHPRGGTAERLATGRTRVRELPSSGNPILARPDLPRVGVAVIRSYSRLAARPASAGSSMYLTSFNCGSYRRGLRSSLVLARKPSRRPGCTPRAVSNSVRVEDRLASAALTSNPMGPRMH